MDKFLRSDPKAFAAHPETTGSSAVSRPMNGADYLDSLRERVEDVTTPPAFRSTARMTARVYDALHDPAPGKKLTLPTDTGNCSFTHAYFKAPKTPEDLLAGRNAIAEWAKITYGWLRCSQDYKASLLAKLGANTEFYAPSQENALRWYRFSQERVPFVNHDIIHPPVDRNRPPNKVADVCCHVEKETDGGNRAVLPVRRHGLGQCRTFQGIRRTMYVRIRSGLVESTGSFRSRHVQLTQPLDLTLMTVANSLSSGKSYLSPLGLSRKEI
jgi:hypothetical protein